MGLFDFFKKSVADKKVDVVPHWQGHPDLQKIVFVTTDCLERGQINWASRSSKLVHENDSGWQFRTGLETPRESEDISSARVISLEEALVLEPLLEQILDKSEGIYYCNRTLNQFIEIKEQ